MVKAKRTIPALVVAGLLATTVPASAYAQPEPTPGPTPKPPPQQQSQQSKCWPGAKYGGGGTDHNYVEFHVDPHASKSWHVENGLEGEIFPAKLWANPDGNGVAHAGINRTDSDPFYSPNAYWLCTGS